MLRSVTGSPIEPPEPDGRWLKVTKEAWADFWASDVAQAVRPKDLPTLHRLFELRNLYQRTYRIVNKEPLIAGSQGQPVLNPAARLMKDTMGEIRQLEREFGLTPDAGVRMVSQAAQATRSVEELVHYGDDDLQIIDVSSDTGT